MLPRKPGEYMSGYEAAARSMGLSNIRCEFCGRLSHRLPDGSLPAGWDKQFFGPRCPECVKSGRTT